MGGFPSACAPHPPPDSVQCSPQANSDEAVSQGAQTLGTPARRSGVTPSGPDTPHIAGSPQ